MDLITTGQLEKLFYAEKMVNITIKPYAKLFVKKNLNHVWNKIKATVLPVFVVIVCLLVVWGNFQLQLGEVT